MTLQEMFDHELSTVGERIAAEILANKLEAQGVKISARVRDKIYAMLRAGEEQFTLRPWRFWERGVLDVEITAEDLHALDAACEEFLEHGLPELVQNIVSEASAAILQTLKRGWRREARRQTKELAEFRRRFGARWRKAFDSLHFFIALSREFGEWRNRELRDTPDSSHVLRIDVITRLHGRGCQITEEALALSAHGFADGAMARWRTLHETAVVALFIHEGDEDLAERYIRHQSVESYKAALEYARCEERLGFEPITANELQELEVEYDRLKGTYGREYTDLYGWAAAYLGIQRPGFADIERAVGIDHLRPYYWMASHTVHANPKGAFFKLGLLPESELILAGPSDIGFADPGQMAAISLMQLNVPLVTIMPTMDSLVSGEILQRVSGEVMAAFTIHNDVDSESAA